MSGMSVDVVVDTKFKINIIYNGVTKHENVEASETIKRVLERAIQLFQPIPQPHLLALYTEAGKELTNEGETVRQAGIKPGDTLLLRPSQVRGGAGA
jgi:hypothetical protein